MKREVASQIAHFLNTPKIIDALNGYANDRIDILRLGLETAKDPVEIHRLQGAIQELKLIYKIREDALRVVDLEKAR